MSNTPSLICRNNVVGPQPCSVTIPHKGEQILVTSSTYEQLLELTILIKSGAMDISLGLEKGTPNIHIRH